LRTGYRTGSSLLLPLDTSSNYVDSDLKKLTSKPHGDAMISPLSPLITGPLLYLLTRTPERLAPHLNPLLTYLPSSLPFTCLINLLKLLFALGTIYRASSALTERSLNNGEWRGDVERWDWEKEVAVVTGGCSGIGEEVVRGLADRGVRVVVLDVAELPDRLKDGTRITLSHSSMLVYRTHLCRLPFFPSHPHVRQSYPSTSKPI
jgi:hypothetical protein